MTGVGGRRHTPVGHDGLGALQLLGAHGRLVEVGIDLPEAGESVGHGGGRVWVGGKAGCQLSLVGRGNAKVVCVGWSQDWVGVKTVVGDSAMLDAMVVMFGLT